MSEETTQNISDGGRDGHSFEDACSRASTPLIQACAPSIRVCNDLDARLQKLEERAYDKPIWEQALKEILETRREPSRRLDRIEAIANETRADLRDAEDRIGKLESEPAR